MPDGVPQLLGLLIERRWHIVSARQKTLVRIHEQAVKLVPGGVPRGLSADKTARLLRTIRPTDPVAAMRRRVVVELLAELRVLDRKRKAIHTEIDQALANYGTCLTDIDGAHGRSWNQIGVALGVTRQAARQRFADKVQT